MVDDQFEILINDTSGFWVDGEFRIEGKELMALCQSIERAVHAQSETLEDSAELATLRAERDALRELHEAVVDYVASTHHVPSNDVSLALDRIDKLGEQDG